jgi:hypothetical protein
MDESSLETRANPRKVNWNRRGCERRYGVGCNTGSSCSRSANCFGEKFVRRAEYRGDGDVAKVVFLDRVLAHYGPEAKQAREVLRSAVVRVLDQMWSKDRTSPSQLEPTSAGAEVLADKIQELSPKDDTQRSLQAQSMSIVMAIGQTRWLMYKEVFTMRPHLIDVRKTSRRLPFSAWPLVGPCPRLLFQQHPLVLHRFQL